MFGNVDTKPAAIDKTYAAYLHGRLCTIYSLKLKKDIKAAISKLLKELAKDGGVFTLDTIMETMIELRSKGAADMLSDPNVRILIKTPQETK